MKTTLRIIIVGFVLTTELLIFSYWNEILLPFLHYIIPFGDDQIPGSGPIFWLAEFGRWAVLLAVINGAVSEIRYCVSPRSNSIAKTTVTDQK